MLADDNGSYTNNGQPSTYYKVENADDKSLRYYVKLEKEQFNKKISETHFKVTKYFYYHTTSTNFIRKIIRFTNSSTDFDKCLLIYYGAPTELKLTVHGNSKKSNRLQYRSSGSLLDDISESSQLHGSVTANYNKLVEKRIPEASISEIPKNKNQITNRKFYIKSENTTHFTSKDELFDAIYNMHDGKFVRNCEIMHDTYRTVCFSDQQICDLVRFCAIGNSVCNIDTTFRIGDFYVTLTVFRNLCLRNRRTNTNPLYIGKYKIKYDKSKIKRNSQILRLQIKIKVQL